MGNIETSVYNDKEIEISRQNIDVYLSIKKHIATNKQEYKWWFDSFWFLGRAIWLS